MLTASSEAMTSIPVAIADTERRVIPGWPDYAVSVDGRVWVLMDEVWTELTPCELSTGPNSVWLQNSGGRKAFNIKSLVERVFGTTAVA